jgi:hypothetical protein
LKPTKEIEEATGEAVVWSYRDTNDAYVHFYDSPLKFIPASIFLWFKTYRALQTPGIQPIHRDETHYRYVEAHEIYSAYLGHFQQQVQQRSQAGRNDAYINEFRSTI